MSAITVCVWERGAEYEFFSFEDFLKALISNTMDSPFMIKARDECVDTNAFRTYTVVFWKLDDPDEQREDLQIVEQFAVLVAQLSAISNALTSRFCLMIQIDMRLVNI
jgi:hypothetical protein